MKLGYDTTQALAVEAIEDRRLAGRIQTIGTLADAGVPMDVLAALRTVAAYLDTVKAGTPR